MLWREEHTSFSLGKQELPHGFIGFPGGLLPRSTGFSAADPLLAPDANEVVALFAACAGVGLPLGYNLEFFQLSGDVLAETDSSRRNGLQINAEMLS